MLASRHKAHVAHAIWWPRGGHSLAQDLFNQSLVRGSCSATMPISLLREDHGERRMCWNFWSSEAFVIALALRKLFSKHNANEEQLLRYTWAFLGGAQTIIGQRVVAPLVGQATSRICVLSFFEWLLPPGELMHVFGGLPVQILYSDDFNCPVQVFAPHAIAGMLHVQGFLQKYHVDKDNAGLWYL